MAEHLNDSGSNVPPSEDETFFRPSSGSNSESFGFLLKGLLEASLENQNLLKELVTNSTNKTAQNKEQAPPSSPTQ